MGRLASGPHALLGELLLDPQVAAAGHVLPDLLQIDAAHVVMLAARGLLSEDSAARLLEVTERDLAFDPRACVEAAAYGGGPAPAVVAAQVEALEPRLARLRRTQGERRATLALARARLSAAVEDVKRAHAPAATAAPGGAQTGEDAAAHGRASQ